MLFPASQHEQLRNGSITLAFRRWERPSVRAGGTLITPVGQLAIDAVDVVGVDDVTAEEAHRAGLGDLAELREWLGPDRADRQLHRIAFHLLGDDPRIALRADEGNEAERVVMRQRLARMDARSSTGPWTSDVLALIGRHPGTRAGDLAAMLDMPRDVFKPRVRRLKSIGLTESLRVGYRLSPRGERLLRDR